jgi:hypothetical protein
MAYASCYLFPNGRFVPRRAWLIIAAYAAWQLLPVPAAHTALDYTAWPPLLQVLPWLLWWGSAAAAIVYRYRVISTPAERQQTKWAVYGLAVAVLGTIGLSIMGDLGGGMLARGSSALVLWDLSVLAAKTLAILLIPLSLGAAIMRYHLWDIDLLISRTLVYVPLTAILAGLYSASVALFQRIFMTATGQRSDAAVILSTLVLAAAFTPIRDGLQHTIDRSVKEARDPLKELKVLGRQIDAVQQVVSAGRLTREFLDRAVQGLEAQGGGLYLVRGGQLGLVHVAGEWHEGQVVLSVPLRWQGREHGVLHLGPRRAGMEYRRADRETLARTAEQVAGMLELLQGGLGDGRDGRLPVRHRLRRAQDHRPRQH